MGTKALAALLGGCALGIVTVPQMACDDPGPPRSSASSQLLAPDSPARPRELPRTRIATAAQDLDGDGDLEEIHLLADVELAADGTPLWEDGHRWAILVRDGTNEHTVVDEFVPQGRLVAWVVQPPEGASMLVVLRESGTTGIGLRGFRHSDGGYAEVDVLDGRLVARLDETRD